MTGRVRATAVVDGFLRGSREGPLAPEGAQARSLPGWASLTPHTAGGCQQAPAELFQRS